MHACRFVALTLALAVPSLAQPASEDRPAAEKPAEEPAMTAAQASSPLDFTMADIEGKPVALSAYKGKVTLFVNVASRCGLTPQYAQLQNLHETYRDKGLVVLGFPANDFGGQEPGTNKEIQEFCSTKYQVAFPMFAKVSVKGEGSCELYKFLTSAEKNKDFAGPIEWNFTKFLVDREGKVIARFGPRTKPDDAKVIEAVEAALR